MRLSCAHLATSECRRISSEMNHSYCLELYLILALEKANIIYKEAVLGGRKWMRAIRSGS